MFEKDDNRKQFISQRDIATAVSEYMESYRRRKVLEGEWTEQESHAKLRAELKEIEDTVPLDSQEQKMRREYEEYEHIMKQMQHPKER